MIIYDKLWETMKEKRVTKYRLREKHGIDHKTLNQLKNNKNVHTKTLDRLCEILDCNLEDIATYIKKQKDV